MIRSWKSQLSWLKKPYGENETPEQIAAAEAAAAALAAKGGGGDDKLKFTPEQQTHINSLLAAEKRRGAEENKKIVADLEKLKNVSGTTAKEKSELQAKIDRLEKEHMTKEELAQHEYKKAQTKLSEDLSQMTEKEKGTRAKYEKHRINSELTAAAADNKAVRVSQIVAMFSGSTKLVPVFDADGKETNEDQVMMTVNLDGKSHELKPAEALKLISEHEDYANLFKGEGTGGLGVKKTAGGKVPVLDPTKFGDLAYYTANREAIVASQNPKKS